MKHELVEVPRSVYGVFCGGECYVINYAYTTKSAGNKDYILYFWQVSDGILVVDEFSTDSINTPYQWRIFPQQVMSTKKFLSRRMATSVNIF